MKRLLPLLLTALPVFAQAQKDAVFYQTGGAAYQVPALSIDSVKFPDGSSRAQAWLHDGRTVSYAVSSLDSICFVRNGSGKAFPAAQDIANSVNGTVLPSAAEIAKTSVDEVVPTEKSDPEYDDFWENYTPETTVTIEYSGTSAKYSGTLPKGVAVSIKGAHVVVSSTKGKVRYRLQGSTDNGSFKIADMGEDNKKLILELYGVNNTNPMGAAINIQSGKAVYVRLQQGKDNFLKDGAVYAKIDGEDMKGAFFSEGQLLFSGAGNLTVTSIGGHGISSDDYIRIRQNTGKITVNSVKDGFSTKDRLVMYGGTVNITSADEGISVSKGGFIQYGGSLAITTKGSKAHAVSATGNVHFAGGLLDARVMGAASKCLTSDSLVNVTGGFARLAAGGDPEFDADRNDYSTSACIKAAKGVWVSGGAILVMSNGGAGGKCINTDAGVSMENATVTAVNTGSDFSKDSYSAKSRVVDAVNVTIGKGALVQLAGARAAIHSSEVLSVSGGQAFAYTLDGAANPLTGKSALVQTGGMLLWGK